MKQFTLLYFFFIMFLATMPVDQVQAQAEDSKFNMTVSLNSDQFFGFYPFFAGSYTASEKLDFTFYGILWSGGTGGGWGNWTEFGAGLSFNVSDALSVNPQIGFLGGNLLSSGVAGPAIFGDGFVPSLTIGLDDDKTEGEIYLGYYSPLRDEAPLGGTTLAYLHYWANFGYKFSSFISAGAHYEQLILAGGSNVETSSDVYQWFGPYVQFSDPGGKGWARYSFGTDLLDGGDSFFKLTVGVNF